MFVINDDLSIYATRGDTVFFTVTAEDNGSTYYFEAGDVLRMKIFRKKDAETVVLEKLFPVTARTDRFVILLTEEDTKFGDVISKPTDYWYEIELNPFTNPQTIIGYDEDGAKVFRLFPEGADSEVPETDPEDIPVVDNELDMTSHRPVENQAIARAIVNLEAAYKVTKEEVNSATTQTADGLAVERARIDTLVSGAAAEDAELVDIRVGSDGFVHGSAGTAVRSQISALSNKIRSARGKNLFNVNDTYNGYLTTTGELSVVGDWMTSGYIDVTGLSSIVCSNNKDDIFTPYNLMFLCTYDASKKFIEQVYDTGSDTYTVGENVKYVRFCYHANEVSGLQVESGTTRTKYEQYSESHEFSNNKTYSRHDDVSFGFKCVADVLERRLERDVITDTEETELILNHPYVISGTADDSFGNPLYIASEETVFKVSEKIEIEPFALYLLNASAGYGHLLYAVYDEHDNILEYMQDDTGNGTGTALADKVFVAPYMAKYIRISQYDTVYASAGIKKIVSVSDNQLSFAEKKWVCMGDSLTEFNLRSDKNYHDYIAEKTGITVVNMGSSGTGYKRTEDEGKAFYQRIANVPIDADVVTIFGSGNDLLHIDVLGSPTDATTDTICGCVNATIDALYSKLPAVQLGIISPTPWIYNQPSDNGTMARYSNALKEICNLRGIPFLDLFRCSGLRPNDKTYRELVYSKDEGNGVHPNELGHKIIASHIKAFLDTLII